MLVISFPAAILSLQLDFLLRGHPCVESDRE